ncbi:MAG: cation-transporting P-type ATPase, partial [bacterium]|nr:cation-transporting P-type ATPase [bacterium]
MVQCTFKEIALKEQNEALAFLSSQPEGLSAGAVLERLRSFGKNEVTSHGIAWSEILFRQFRSAFIYLLLAASAIALYLGEYLDAGIIFLFLLINAGLGFFQEYRAENALQLLKQFVERNTRVRRSGKTITVPVRDIVPGDIVVLDAGDMIPADGYFLRADGVTVDESPMTGESVPVAKVEGKLAEAPSGFYDAHNIGFSRTTLLSGDAELVIFATGDRTEVGAIAKTMHEQENPSAFEEGVSRFSTFILKLILATVPLVFLLHAAIQGEHVGLGEFLLFSIALTVSAIPEALPLVTTIALSRGALLLAKKHVVPRRLSAIE